MSLKGETFSAIRWTTLGTIGRSAFQFSQMVILARMLTPDDFGLMAIVFAVMAFMQVFSDAGVSSAIIHHQNISENQLSSLYWLSIIIGLGLMALLIVASPIISVALFQVPEVQPVLRAISFNILFLVVGQQVRVMAEKSLRFSLLAKIELAAAFFGSSSAIVWAWYSPTVYALVAGLLVNSFVQSMLLWLFASQGWRPRIRLRLREIVDFLKFGSYMIGNNLVNSVNQQADLFVGGRLFSTTTLGIYSLPRSLSLNVGGVINPIITRVGFPVMAKLQDDKPFLKSVYLKTMRMTASINFPVYIALAVFSQETIRLLFGEKWDDSAPLLTYLAVWGMFRSCGNPVGSLLLAVGKADLSFKWNFALLFVVFPSLWVASHFGIFGLAFGQAALMAVLLIPGWYFLVRPNCGARLGEYVLSLLSPLLAAVLAVLAGYLAVLSLTSPLWRLIGAVLVTVPVYFAVSWVINRSWLVAMRQLVFSQWQFG